jgi:UDP-glucose 4-epimerase
MLAWVVGSGGLLGSHVVAALGGSGMDLEVWDPGPAKVPWHDPEEAARSLAERAERFAVAAKSRSWALIWCAGAGVVGSSAATLAIETGYFEQLLGLLGAYQGPNPGKILLASSAGGVYAGNPGLPLSEASRCVPMSDYGRNKLRQEELLARWASLHPGVSTLVARISNLYGPGQNVGKPQGLIAHISRSLIHRTPVHVYVPLDTLRDYVYVADCAAQLVAGLTWLRQRPAEQVTKILHSGEMVTIAGILGAFTRIARGHPRIICAPNFRTQLQPARLQFRSTVWPDLPPWPRTSLVVGIQRVYWHQLALFQQGQLP